MSKIIILTAIFISVSFAPIASAQKLTSTDSAKPNRVSDSKLERKTEYQDIRMMIKDRQDKKKIEIQSKRDEYKNQLQELNDQKKAKIAESIDTRLALLNQKATNKLTSGIEKIQVLLDKFSSRVEKAKSEGMDTTSASKAITEAELAIENAKVAIAEQAAKAYVANVDNEETLKNSIGLVVSSLRQDLKSTFEIVKIAKSKVMDVASEVSKLRYQDSTNEATESALDD
jgi:hypothetical protein